MTTYPFNIGASTTNLQASATSVAVALPAGFAQPSGAEVRLANVGSNAAFVAFGTSTITTTTSTGTPIGANTAFVFGLAPNITHMAAITPTGTTSVYATMGKAGGG